MINKILTKSFIMAILLVLIAFFSWTPLTCRWAVPNTKEYYGVGIVLVVAFIFLLISTVLKVRTAKTKFIFINLILLAGALWPIFRYYFIMLLWKVNGFAP
jgi:hypothetical protein